MKEMNEQGFLSDKFDDWSGEPIPNGWGEIEKQLRKDKKRRPLFWWLFPAVLLVATLSYLAVEKFNSLPASDETIVMSEPSPSPAETGTTVERNRILQKPENMTPKTEDASEDQSSVRASKHKQQENPASPEATEANSLQEKGTGVTRRQAVYGTHPGGSTTLIASEDQKHSTVENQQSGSQQNSDIEGSNLIMAKTSGRHKKGKSQKLRFLNELAVAGFSSREKSGHSKNGSDLDAVSGAVVLQIEGSETKVSQAKNDLAKEVSGKQDYTQATDVPYLDLKNARFPLVQVPEILPVLTIRELSEVPFLTLEKPESVHKVRFYTGLQTGIGQNTIELRQSMSEQQVQITNANSIQTYFAQLSGGMHIQLNSWLQAFTGLQVGVINQKIQYKTKSKSPEKFSMTVRDSLNFDMTPQWTEKSETRNQMAVYANAEAGLKPMLFPGRKSGPFASVTVWTRILEKHSSDVPGSSPFVPVSNSVSLGYRLGYQHEVRKSILFEAYLSSFPSGIFAATKGVSISPRLVGLGCFYSF